MRLHRQYAQSGKDSESGSVWFGDPKDRTLGDIKVHLEQQSTNIAIVLSRDSAHPKTSETLLAKDRGIQRTEVLREA